ncbi:MAG TPA: Rpn family recombination-promoting nuclease/putative transposase [Desulfosporosinus sp.]|nr:Rpn family recombination-promoting nuclease/putative transposase [Desulfosporosinus sp.]
MVKDSTFVLRRTNDYFFKYVFGSEEGSDVLIDFLNATQNRPPNNRIKTVKLEDREIDPERYMDKAIRLDVVATTELGHVYQIEVQVADQIFIDQRSLYYWASLYHRQLQQGKLFNELKPTIGISILGFEWFKKDDRYHHVFHLKDDETGEKLNEDLELHYLELPKIKNLKRGPQSALEEWLVYLSDIQGEGLEAIVMSNPMIGKALSIEEQFKANAQERRLYDMREKAIFSEATNLAAAEAKGKVIMAQDSICKYLEARLGVKSQALQETVYAITELETLSRIMNRIYIVNHLEEATALIQDYLVSQ